MTTTEEEAFICVRCDHLFELKAPDSEHTEPKKKKDETKDQISVDHVCVSCGTATTVFWGIRESEHVI
jgi:rubredoxin